MKKKLLPYKTHLVFGLLISCLTNLSYANYYGRFTSGGFISKEIFRNELTSDRYNDVTVFSQRFFISIEKFADTTNEFTADIRDKHDFFDKLDTERLKLTSSNKLQVHQLNIHTVGNNEGLVYEAGRFPINEAGSIFIDGGDIGIRSVFHGFNTKLSFFAGLNPTNPEDSELTLNGHAKAYGLYGVLENRSKEWNRAFYTSSAIVKQSYDSDTDRFYLFNNIFWQQSSTDNFSSLLYLDMNPYVSIQNLWTSYLFSMTNNYKLRSTISTIDSLHYQRIQDVRETLPSSRYHQASFSLRSPSSNDSFVWENKLTLGKRLVDSKSKFEYKIGLYLPKFIKDEFSATLNAGVRKNFVSDDLFGGFGLTHSNKEREISFNQDVVVEKRDGKALNIAFISDGSYTKFLSRSLFGILSLQNTLDNNVSIFSVLFKISYRFGDGGQAPIRDGSAPMGQL